MSCDISVMAFRRLTCQLKLVRELGSEVIVRIRSVVAALMMFAFILPSLVQALPSPSLTPEQALLKDITTSICSKANGNEKRDQDDRSCQHCILCAAPSFGLARLDGGPPTVLAINNSSVADAETLWFAPNSHPHARETGPPRGPPLLS
jgi:hypothetical protein